MAEQSGIIATLLLVVKLVLGVVAGILVVYSAVRWIFPKLRKFTREVKEEAAKQQGESQSANANT
ncbi:MAG: hypothetical protein DRN26_02845 [Thermoplasmata archaeon]|nr:MAG: hypothetical protein DRN26_02845 [Thermoplasmata archaeon]